MPPITMARDGTRFYRYGTLARLARDLANSN